MNHLHKSNKPTDPKVSHELSESALTQFAGRKIHTRKMHTTYTQRVTGRV